MASPRKALAMLVQAPEYVHRCAETLDRESFFRYLTRAFGVLGTGYGILESFTLSESAFASARGTGSNDRFELAAIDCRQAAVQILRGQWEEAHHRANAAVREFERDPRVEEERDDCGLANALSVRAFIAVEGHAESVDRFSLEEVVADANQALYQYYLALEGKWQKALEQNAFLTAAFQDHVPYKTATLALWQDALRARSLTAQAIRRAFQDIRGVRIELREGPGTLESLPKYGARPDTFGF